MILPRGLHRVVVGCAGAQATPRWFQARVLGGEYAGAGDQGRIGAPLVAVGGLWIVAVVLTRSLEIVGIGLLACLAMMGSLALWRTCVLLNECIESYPQRAQEEAAALTGHERLEYEAHIRTSRPMSMSPP